MAWNVEGTDQFTDWYLSLDAAETGRIDAAVELLEEHGPALGRPLVDTVTGSAFANRRNFGSPPALVSFASCSSSILGEPPSCCSAAISLVNGRLGTPRTPL